MIPTYMHRIDLGKLLSEPLERMMMSRDALIQLAIQLAYYRHDKSATESILRGPFASLASQPASQPAAQLEKTLLNHYLP